MPCFLIVHLINPFKLGNGVKYFGGYDWGFNHPFAFVLCAITQDKKIYVVSHATAAKKRIDEQAKMINDIVGDKKITIYCGHDCWDGSKGPTVASQLRLALPRLSFIKANIKRAQAVAILRGLFAYQGTELNDPQLKFFKNTEPVYDVVSGMQFDEKKPEDVIKMDADDYGVGGDDVYDALRYAVVTWLRPKVLGEKKKDPSTADYLKDYIERSDRIMESSFL